MRKRGLNVQNTSPTTLASRIDLKRSSDEEDTPSLENVYTTREYGSGTYGNVKEIKGKKDIVAKITCMYPHLLGSTSSPFCSHHVEPRIMQLLFDQFTFTHITPHLISPVGTHRVVSGTLEKKKDENATSSVIFQMERATAGTMRHYLCKQARYSVFEQHVCVFLFQICYTLGAIYMRYPNFRHNDLKDDNVLLYKSKAPGGYTHYNIYGSTYRVPCIGYTAMISDFDFATIGGDMFDNFKTLEDEWRIPSYRIGVREDQGADLYCLVSYMRANTSDGYFRKFKPKFMDRLNLIFGDRGQIQQNCRAIPGQFVPTVEQVVCESGLFDAFLCGGEEAGGEGMDGMDCYWASRVDASKTPSPPPFPSPPSFWNATPHFSRELKDAPADTRQCCVIYPRGPNAKQRLAHLNSLQSFIYYKSLAPSNPVHDCEADCCDPYVRSEGKRIIRFLCAPYSSPWYPENEDSGGYGFDPALMPEFMTRTTDVAEQFLINNWVPSRWWCIAFSCAFNDVAHEMGLYKPKQCGWTIDDWTLFWREEKMTDVSSNEMLHFYLQWTWQRERDVGEEEW